MNISKKQRGSLITFVLVFGAVFLISMGGILSFILFQHKASLQKSAWEESLHIAEAGINYAKWHIAHWPDDFSFSGTYDYKNTAGEVVGAYQLEIIEPTACDPGIKIKSTGWTNRFPDKKRTLQATLMKTSIASFAFVSNSNVWFGPNETIKGPFHSNGGIRMDGSQNAISTSAKQTYLCGPEHGCDPAEEKPGIWGEGEGQSLGLWEFPVQAIDFTTISQNLSYLKQEAEMNGIYLPNLGLGYYIHFNSDGTIDVYRVRKLKQKVWGYNGEDWVHETNDIEETEFYTSYTLPSNCGPIFVEDNVWVDGTVNGRVVLVAAQLPETPNTMKKIIINGNIDYEGTTSVLALIAQKDILIPLYAPDNLTIKAVMMAQNGSVMRYYYPWWYSPYHIRDYIVTEGAIITNKIWTFTWVDEDGEVISGYRNTEMSYRANLAYNPPPYFPEIGEYQIVEWQETQ
ncbi:hypothetical protein J7L09_02350 [bacterium]|nr:hypothetical protein [bacterium]